MVFATIENGGVSIDGTDGETKTLEWLAVDEGIVWMHARLARNQYGWPILISLSPPAVR